MQTLDIERPGMPDLQFVLLVAALCTSGLPECNVPEPLRAVIFDRCWMLIHEGPPPTKVEERVLELRAWTEVTLDAMLETIRSVLSFQERYGKPKPSQMSLGEAVQFTLRVLMTASEFDAATGGVNPETQTFATIKILDPKGVRTLSAEEQGKFLHT